MACLLGMVLIGTRLAVCAQLWRVIVAVRRATVPDPETASAIEQLVQARSAGLYALGAKVRELTNAREAVKAAQESERALHGEALDLQEQLITAGWTVEELRGAGLYVGAPAVVRRRRRTPVVADSGVVGPIAEPAVPAAVDNSETGTDGVSRGADTGPTVAVMEVAGPVSVN